MHIETKCIHSGEGTDTITKGLITPIFPSSSHEYLDAEDVAYPRYFNTINQKVIVRKICELEEAEDGIIFSSGMAAISTVLLSFLKADDHVILQDEIYGGSHVFVEMFFERLGISYSFVATNAESIESAIKPETRIIFIETPTNPLLSIVDIQEVAPIDLLLLRSIIILWQQLLKNWLRKCSFFQSIQELFLQRNYLKVLITKTLSK